MIVTGALLAAGVMLATAAWAAPEALPAVQAQESPRAASLEIAIWPEFDRQAMALVVLRGKLADDVPLPATFSLHVPTSSGGPSAVASAESETATLLSLDYSLAAAEDSLLVTMTTPAPYFHIEFYDPLTVNGSDRSYAYVWPGDLAVDDLTLEVQEPAGATNLSVKPELGDGTEGVDQLVYRSADMGPFESGKTLGVNVNYTKADLRTSVEILGVAEGEAPGPQPGESGDGVPLTAILAAAVAALVVLVGAVVYFRWRRRPVVAPGGPPSGARRGARGASGSGEKQGAQAFCTQCGDRLIAGYRFCPRCGTAARPE
jgi:hypothetical protein